MATGNPNFSDIDLEKLGLELATEEESKLTAGFKQPWTTYMLSGT